MDYKQKYLKYKKKYMILKGGNKFDFIESIKKCIKREIEMDPNDIITKTHIEGYTTRGCKICGSFGGSSGNIPHFYVCKYSNIKTAQGQTIRYRPYDAEKMKMPPYEELYPVYQREIFVTSDEYKKVGTYGAGPCIIVAMRDPNKKIVALAHIDAMTKDPMLQFYNIFRESQNVDIYLCGGNNSNIEQCESILRSIYKEYQYNQNKYNVVFCHLVDNNANSFGIDAVTGDYYFDNISPRHMIRIISEQHVSSKRPDTYNMRLMMPSELRYVK